MGIDLSKRNPFLVQFWDLKKNRTSIEGFEGNTKSKVWLFCPICSRSWEASVSNVIKMKSFHCLRRLKPGVNDVETICPEIMEEFHPYKNDPKLNFPKWYAYSVQKFWWLCPNGHEWESEIRSRLDNKRTRNSKFTQCPYCALGRISQNNCLAFKNPEILKEWDYSNNTLSPELVSYGSAKKAWWICKNGHSWKAEIRSRVGNGNGCPVCAGLVVISGINDLNSQNPISMKDWDFNKNSLNPCEIYKRSKIKVWWKCHKCKLSTFKKICHWVKTGCPNCNKFNSRPERILRDFLKDYGSEPVETTLPVKIFKKRKGIKCDVVFLLEKIVVEYDGVYWHSDSNIRNIDYIKTYELLRAGWKVIRVRENGLVPLYIPDPNYKEFSIIKMWSNKEVISIGEAIVDLLKLKNRSTVKEIHELY